MTNERTAGSGRWLRRGATRSLGGITANRSGREQFVRGGARTVAVLLTIGVSGCASSEIPPEEKEAINLGSNVDVGPVGVDNLLLVTRGEGEPARLIGVLLNEAATRLTVTLSDEDDEISVDLEPGQQYAFHEHPTFFDTADGIPGALSNVSITVESDTELARIPIRDGSLPWLEPYVPDLVIS